MECHIHAQHLRLSQRVRARLQQELYLKLENEAEVLLSVHLHARRIASQPGQRLLHCWMELRHRDGSSVMVEHDGSSLRFIMDRLVRKARHQFRRQQRARRQRQGSPSLRTAA